MRQDIKARVPLRKEKDENGGEEGAPGKEKKQVAALQRGEFYKLWEII